MNTAKPNVSRERAEGVLALLQTTVAKGVNISQIEFNRAVRQVLDFRIATATELRSRFKVSHSTIHRWRSTNAPHPSMRHTVIEGLIEETRKHLR